MSFFVSHLNISISQGQSLEQRLESWWTNTFCSQYSFFTKLCCFIYILWETQKDPDSIIRNNLKLNIVKTKPKNWKWLLDIEVFFLLDWVYMIKLAFMHYTLKVPIISPKRKRDVCLLRSFMQTNYR